MIFTYIIGTRSHTHTHPHTLADIHTHQHTHRQTHTHTHTRAHKHAQPGFIYSDFTQTLHFFHLVVVDCNVARKPLRNDISENYK